MTIKGKHDLVITKKDGNIQIISEMNHAAMPLHFTLMFPLGTKGWHPDLKQIEGNNKRLTCREFTVFHMNWRSEDDDVNYIHFGSRLFQEWIVIQWLVAENMKLNWMSMNQREVRAETYRNLSHHLTSTRDAVGDALYKNDNRPQVGQKILNKSLVGSPRWYVFDKCMQ